MLRSLISFRSIIEKILDLPKLPKKKVNNGCLIANTLGFYFKH